MRSSFARKLVYMGLALGLFVVILVVRYPIEQQRTTHKLSDATLGDVDPTSSTMLVVLGGLRGVASNILWLQAQDLQNQHDWTNLEVVVNSITTLEPHFVSVWTFQGWNQAYNVAAEWDQVADKYYWIKKGIRFLERGTKANEDSPELRWDVGWTYFHKIGRADESELLRRLFRADTAPEIDAQGRVQPAFNQDGLDNYMTSSGWFQKAVDKCDVLNVKPKRMGEVAFRSYPSHSKIDFAIYREKEGVFGEVIQRDWKSAMEGLQQFADHDFNYTPSRAVHLDYPREIKDDLYRATSIYTDSKDLNEALGKGVDSLTDEQKSDCQKEWDKLLAESQRTIREYNKPTIAFLPQPQATEAFNAMQESLKKMQPADAKDLVQPGTAGDAVRKHLADYAAAAETFGKLADEELYWCDRYATMINYRYWMERAVCEYQKETYTAREHFYQGEQDFKAARLEKAVIEFEAGLDLWKTVMDKYERVRSDDLTAEDTVAIVKTYLSVRDQLGLEDLKPEDVPFKEWIDRFTPHQPTPEEFERMRLQYQQMQKGQQSGDTRKKSILEKVQGTLKEATDPTKAAPAGDPTKTAPPGKSSQEKKKQP